LVGVSAIIPIFRFPNWEYDFLNEVIIYPKAIPGEGRFKGSFINGLVGDGPMEGRMILAKTALLHGYSNHTDRRNVGVHEFAHIIDKQDGKIDGVPEVLLDGSKIGTWLELIRSKSQEIKNKEAKINPYALSNDAEFFAVVTEYFFEHPEMMHKKHPELYETLKDIFTGKKT
jgi:Mlc titration factor MtfA (ptsG expression regulator)